MIRVPMIVLLFAAGLVGCANTLGNHGLPPQDPPDYHGVPTDSRPLAMVPTPVAP
ncbi:MAG: FIG00454785: hypothetical protein [uncultured Paraburkholderia sp.]|nr:MAG: FIG00454785: hypothetical protein [uncultured Paraburkholderia sp.]CAH2925174.1 MAG: FIG00454785: hypothetical protein [uncultured Paraburkholderia sp.]